MHRLLQGDVGSGKTVVALTALLTAVQGGYQGAFMAPTEVLAEQHDVSLRHLLGGLTVPDERTLTGDRPLRVELLHQPHHGRRADPDPGRAWPTATSTCWSAPTPCSRSGWRSRPWA